MRSAEAPKFKATWLDRAIGAVAPRTGLRRLRARMALTATRAYAGAALGRHTDGWRAPSTSADTEIAAAGPRLRDRHRDLVRNNPHAAKAVSAWVSNIVGEGITPRANTGDKTRDKQIMDLFKRWAKKCDADGTLDFYGLQSLACRGMVEGGESFVRRRPRRAKDRLPVPLQLQVIEADLLDASKTGDLGNRSVAIQGVQFDAIGQRLAYWMFAQHPGNNFASFNTRLNSTPVPAGDIVHLFEKLRTQVRGVPWGAPVIRALRDLDDYEFAEGIRKKIASSVVGVVLGADDESESGVTGKPGVVDGKGNPIEQFEPGLFAYARGGKDIKFNTPASDGGFPEYKKVSLKSIAAGYRLPYSVVSGDQGDTNYSGDRSGLIEFRRLVTALQWQLFIPAFCEPVWTWFCEAAWMAGLIESPEIPVEWETPRFEWVDPYKDGLAELLAVRAGLRTLPEALGQRGRNLDDVIEEIKATNAKLDAAGIVLDSDPRKITSAGALQSLPPPDSGAPETAPKK
jgi:lambda family phage portal protein